MERFGVIDSKFSERKNEEKCEARNVQDGFFQLSMDDQVPVVINKQKFRAQKNY